MYMVSPRPGHFHTSQLVGCRPVQHFARDRRAAVERREARRHQRRMHRLTAAAAWLGLGLGLGEGWGRVGVGLGLGSVGVGVGVSQGSVRVSRLWAGAERYARQPPPPWLGLGRTLGLRLGLL